MKKYEVMFIINPTLEEEKREAAIEKIKAVIEADGTIETVDAWGMRKLAYPIEKKNEGYYVVIDFSASTELPKELDRRMRISDDVMRHMIVCKEEK
jgi:small subunit ribosomal protein S6